MNFIKKLFQKEKKGFDSYRKGIHHFNKLQYNAAIPFFEKVLGENKHPHSLEANLAIFYCGRSHVNVGVTHFAKNENQTALYHFEKALLLQPDDMDLNYFIGICLNNIGDYKGAMEVFSKILETEPWNIPTKLKISIIFHNMKLWVEAEDILREILMKNQNFADVHYHLGLALMSQGKALEASDSFKNALSINPQYTEARLKLSITQIYMGNHEKAAENLQRIIIRHPKYADVYYLMAIAQRQDHDQAIACLKQALDISPQFKNALVKLIIVYCRIGDQVAAANQIKKALEFYPEDPRLGSIQKILKIFGPDFKAPSDETSISDIGLEDEHLIKELRHEFHKDLDIMPNVSEIISIFKSSQYSRDDNSISEFLVPFITEQINRNPTYPDLYHSLGTQLLSAQKFIEAENAFANALELNPDYVAARIDLMKTLYRNRKTQEAYIHGAHLIPKNLPFPDVYFTLAEILIDLKRWDMAMVNAKRIMRLRPDDNTTKLLVAKIYKGQKNNKAAIKVLEDFLKNPTTPSAANEARMLKNEIANSNGNNIF